MTRKLRGRPVAWIAGRDPVYAAGRGRFVDAEGRDVTEHVTRNVRGAPRAPLTRQLRQARDRGVEVDLPLDGKGRGLTVPRGVRYPETDLSLCNLPGRCCAGARCGSRRRHRGRHRCETCGTRWDR
jgi:hypothetical protein